MNGNAQTLYWFQSEKVRVEVPFFQRPYVWEEEEWNELLNSIENTPKGNMPFIGSFILQKLTDKYLVIDGQQRITTLSIMIRAYLDAFTELPSNVKPQFENFVYEITYAGLTPQYKTRIIPSNIDRRDFDAVMNKTIDELDSKNGKIIKAYYYFYSYFSSSSKERNEEFGEKLITNNKFFIAIVLDEQDDEQKIFDSVNSLGRDLTNSDIIKNYLYQRMRDLVPNKQMLPNILEFYEKYWVKTFYDGEEKKDFWETKKTLGRIQTNNLEAFLKDFATIKGIYSPSNTGGIDGLAKTYKLHINNMTYDQAKDFAKELSEYANCYYLYNSEYAAMSDFKLCDYINVTLLILDKLETTTFNPFILKILKEKPADMEAQIRALQKFVFMRFIYKAKTKNYNKVCENLLSSANPIEYLDKYDDSIPIVFNQYPAGLKSIKNKHAILVLFMLELIKRNGKENMFSDNLKYVLSLEHTMPQKWETYWAKVPCYKYDKATSDFVEVTAYNEVVEHRKSMIYAIGNMTLLTGPLNSSLSNAPFSEKVLGKLDKGGYKKYAGALCVANEIVEQFDNAGTWDERNINDRCLTIFNELNKYFNFTNFKIAEI